MVRTHGPRDSARGAWAADRAWLPSRSRIAANCDGRATDAGLSNPPGEHSRMSWLERLKAHDSDTREVGGHCQNRQNPGSVSFDGASIARIPSNQGANADPWADRAVALH